MIGTVRESTSDLIEDQTSFVSRQRRVAAWLVHLFTASGAVFGLIALWSIHEGRLIQAFWLMAVTLLIDSVDGMLARRARTTVAAPKIDGELLDNMIDYFTYVLVPAFFLLTTDLLPPGWAFIGTSLIVLASAYQFTQPEAKTHDHFFKGFPSYWNIVVFYLFFWQMSPRTNLIIVLILSLLVFVPIKYVYPSRLEYLTRNPWLRGAMLAATVLWGVATGALLWIYPDTNRLLVILSIGYAVFYVLISVYRTFVPLEGVSLEGDDS